MTKQTAHQDARTKLLVLVLLALAVPFGCGSGSLVVCPLVPAYSVCRAVPVCRATRIERDDRPSWSCRSRLWPWS